MKLDYTLEATDGSNHQLDGLIQGPTLVVFVRHLG